MIFRVKHLMNGHRNYIGINFHWLEIEIGHDIEENTQNYQSKNICSAYIHGYCNWHGFASYMSICCEVTSDDGNENRSGVIEDRGREPVQSQSKKKRDQSKSREGSSWECVMEDMGELLEIVEHNIEMLEGHNVQACLDADTLRDDRLTRLEAKVMDALQAMQISIEILREDLAVCKKTATTVGASTSVVSPRVDYPKPNVFDGRRDAKKVENFLWQMERYFEGLNLTNEASRKELKQHFYPKNVVYEARKKLRELKQQGTIREYVKGFTTIMLQIPNLSKEDLLFHFVAGLQQWAKQKLHRRDVKSVDEAIAVAESLIEYQPYMDASKKKEKWNPTKGGGEKRDNRDQRKTYPPKGGDRNPSQKETSNIRSIRLLNALNAKLLPATSSKGLMYVEAYVSGKPTKALTVNANAQPLNGVVKNVELCLGTWKDQVDFSVAPMDDFKVVLGMDFLRKVTTIPMPSFNSVCILEKERLAMQITKGVKRGKPTYLATLKEEVPAVTKEEDLPPIIQNVLEENKDVMPDELPKKLPPRQEVDHKIELESGTKQPAMAPYRMAPPELEELRRQLTKLLDTGRIRPSKAPYGAPVMCVDYRALNNVTIKNRYPIPLIANLFDRLGGAKIYTKIDLQKGYYQVWIAEGDELKTACITRYGSFEWLSYLDPFLVVYLDDIVMYSNSLEEHANHLRTVFQVLRENELYVKKEKCSFAKEEVLFLGYIIGHGQLQMDGAKIRAIVEWEAPTKVTGLWSFLGLVNYYRRFIQGYSAWVAPLMDLLKKGKIWEWSEKCQHAFDDLKAAVSSELVLALSDFDKPFELHTNALDFAIERVLMQEGHPIVFESHKLNHTERRYTIQEKEMTTIIHCLRVYFQTQKKLSPKQARWQDFLAEFDYTLEYKPDKANVLAPVSLAKGEITDLIKQGLEQDPLARELKKLVVEAKPSNSG
ncbi:hypothetical protein Pfo_008017 [Paulownia fortunei]|nr:hypothetical protein Pfo_008017 [Paulownia fortunei]